jgi:hypothetical protein
MNEDHRDRLYELLPAVYRHRDAEVGLPLRSLLQVIEEQVDVVEQDIERLYENWFIETCEDWVVPYIADIVGYRPVHESGEPGDTRTISERTRGRTLVPRREVANTVHNRRRKGTLALLELVARDVAGWPARAVEFYRLLAFTQALNHQQLGQGRTVDVRRPATLARLGGHFDELAHTVDVRRVGSLRSRGRYNLFNVGLFVWRHRAYSVTETPARAREDIGSHCYTFSVLGNDTPLYSRPEPEVDPTKVARERNLPIPIERRTLEEHRDELYGAGRSFHIRIEDSRRLVLPGKIVPADLGDWSHTPSWDQVAVDPERGRIVFNPRQAPSSGVRVSYHYGFSADIGGGEYRRPVLSPTVQPLIVEDDLKEPGALLRGLRNDRELSPYLLERLGRVTRDRVLEHDMSEPPSDGLMQRLIEEINRILQGEELFGAAEGALREQSGDERMGPTRGQRAKARRIVRLAGQRPRGWDLVRLNRMLLEWAYPAAIVESFALYRVGEDAQHSSLGAALERWREENPRNAVIEIVDSGVYGEPLRISLGVNQTLHLRAANLARPVIRLLDYQTGTPDPLRISGGRGSRFVLDGLLITEYAVRVEGDLAGLTIRHCTLVPGWGLGPNWEPRNPAKPSLELHNTPALRVALESSILGSIQVLQDEVRADPSRISLADSILDATSREREALGSPDERAAHVHLTVQRSTVFGRVQVHAIDLAENSIFEGVVKVARRQIGCMRFCSLMAAQESRTPGRYSCQPDLAEGALRETRGWQDFSEHRRAAALRREQQRVRPHFDSILFGTPAYCQLSESTAGEITRGADDESEMGVFHDLFGPQREATLRARLDEYTPAGMEAAVFFAT